MRFLFSVLVFSLLCCPCFSQELVGGDTTMDLLMTYGNMTSNDNGENGHSDTIYMVIPENYQNSFYVRVFDPDCGGKNDNSNGRWETNTEFGFYGGEGCVSLLKIDKKKISPGTLHGTLLQEELFANEAVIDDSWVSFGPFSAVQGEKLETYSGRFFKLIVEGKTGNDGNQYALALSTSEKENIVLAGANLYQEENDFVADLKDGKYNFSILAEPVDE